MQGILIFVCMAILFHQATVIKTQLVDIVQTAINNGGFTTLVAALNASGLVPALKGTGPFTVFAPTDAAFNKLPAGTIANLLLPQNQAILVRLLEYHVINGQSLNSTQISGMTLPTQVTMMEGDTVTVSMNGTNLMVNSATVIIPNVMATNGIIHAIDTVLMPPTPNVDIVQTAIFYGTFTTLVTALNASGLVPALKGTGPFTVFAPTDAAFNKLPAGTIANLLLPQNQAILVRLLEYHVINGQSLNSTQISGMTLPTQVVMMEGDKVTVSMNGTNLMVNSATVIIPNVMATNGIIHAIDTVLMPPTQYVDIVQTAIFYGTFATLVAALNAAGLVPALKGTGPFTVFAPTDAAFNKLPAGTIANLLLPQNQATLVRLLEYHVINGQSLNSTQISGMTLPTQVTMMEGDTVTVSMNGTNLMVNSATVIIPNVMATNGIIHAIDTVLMPPTQYVDIVQTAIFYGTFTTLVAALNASGLVPALKGTGPFTVFAPTDTAFNKLPAGTIANLLLPQNQATLIRLLEYHVINGQSLNSTQISGMALPTQVVMMEGDTVTVSMNGTNLMVNSATVIIPNVMATNGIIHAIDTVLMPPTPYVDIVQTAIFYGTFTTLVAALNASGLVPALKGTGPFTVFAPTDTAFNKLPAGTIANLLLPQNQATLIRLLEYHVINGQSLNSTQISGMTLPTQVVMMEGDKVTVSMNGTNLMVNNATVIIPNVMATNGIIHAIDTVLMPPTTGSATCFHLNQPLFLIITFTTIFSYLYFV